MKTALLIILGVFADQLTKLTAFHTLGFNAENVVIPKLLSFHLVFNHGAAYGIFQHQRFFLTGISIAVLIAIFYYRHYFSAVSARLLGVGFLLIGTIGNLIDRIRLGYVIDFINIHIIPVFNIADICINLAVVCFLYDMFFNNKKNVPS